MDETGLGLSMVHGLCAQLGGTLHLRSKPGEGMTAEMWLPAAAESAGREELEPAPLVVARRAATILLAQLLAEPAEGTIKFPVERARR